MQTAVQTASLGVPRMSCEHSFINCWSVMQGFTNLALMGQLKSALMTSALSQGHLEHLLIPWTSTNGDCLMYTS